MTQSMSKKCGGRRRWRKMSVRCTIGVECRWSWTARRFVGSWRRWWMSRSSPAPTQQVSSPSSKSQTCYCPTPRARRVWSTEGVSSWFSVYMCYKGKKMVWKKEKSCEIKRKRFNYDKIKAICAEKNFDTLRIKKNRVHSEMHQGSILWRKVSNKMWTSSPRLTLVMQREKNS